MNNKVETPIDLLINNVMGRTLEYPKDAGIYKLTCNITGKIYIGKAIHLNKRINRHKNCKEGSGYLQRAILKYGWNSFLVEVLEIVEHFNKNEDNQYLLDKESYYIELLDTSNPLKGYNVCKFSTDRTGIPTSEETKNKIRIANLGNPKLIEANTGKILSEETKAKISKAHLGNKKTIEHSRNISKGKRGKPSKLKGTVFSEERREKCRQVWIERRLKNL